MMKLFLIVEHAFNVKYNITGYVSKNSEEF